jgi:hypothetical protein
MYIQYNEWVIFVSWREQITFDKMMMVMSTTGLMLRRSKHTNFIVFGFTRPELESTI